MVLQMVLNVPQVQGKCEEVMSALMEQVPDALVYGDEKFCMILYLPGLCSLGMMERGEVWKGPMRSSTCCCEKGPSYLVVLNSRSMICWKNNWYVVIDLSLGGINVWVMYLIPALKPYCKLEGMCAYLSSRLWFCSKECQLRGW